MKKNKDFLQARKKIYFKGGGDIFREVPSFPRNMIVEPSGGCNHRCIFCSRRYGGKNKKGLLSLGLIEKILRQAYALGTREVGFYLCGEPLLHPDLCKMVAIARDLGYEYRYITTNGSLVIPKKLDLLIKSGLSSIKFSINAGSREEYCKVHGVDDFNKVISNFEYAVSKRDKIKVMVSSVFTPETQKNIGLLSRKYKDMLDGFFMSRVEPRPQDNGIRANEEMIPCRVVFNRFHVTADGFFTACCIDVDNDLVLADLNKVSVSTAWKSAKARKLRSLHMLKKTDNTLCGRCQYGGKHPYKSL